MSKGQVIISAKRNSMSHLNSSNNNTKTRTMKSTTAMLMLAIIIGDLK